MIKNNIDFKSFFKKGLIYNDDFSVYLILGAQGTGKTYFGIYLIEEFIKQHSNYKIKSNVKSYIENIKDYRDAEYFQKIRDIENDFSDYTIYFIDELSRIYPKGCSQDTGFLSWLMQSRKCHRIVIMTHQTYLLVPQWLRPPIDAVYSTHHFLTKHIAITEYGTPILDEDTLDWTIDCKERYIYKRNIKIANLYNTYEKVAEL